MDVVISYEYIALPRQATDLREKRFGRLLVVGPIKIRGSYIYWHAKCDCGKDIEVRSSHLLDGSTKSCGCWRSQRFLETFTRHGEYKSRLYKIWAGMIQRCENPKAANYKNYGGRGIRICSQWRSSFENFRDYVKSLDGWDNNELSLDRINNDDNYKPGNVRWATMPEQRRNSRQNRLLTHNGKTQCLMDWAKEYGLSYGRLTQRLEMGWELEKALTTPLRNYTKKESKLWI